MGEVFTSLILKVQRYLSFYIPPFPLFGPRSFLGYGWLSFPVQECSSLIHFLCEMLSIGRRFDTSVLVVRTQLPGGRCMDRRFITSDLCISYNVLQCVSLVGKWLLLPDRTHTFPVRNVVQWTEVRCFHLVECTQLPGERCMGRGIITSVLCITCNVLWCVSLVGRWSLPPDGTHTISGLTVRSTP